MLNHHQIDFMADQLSQGQITALSLVAAIRLEYLNNYLSAEQFAMDHGIPKQFARQFVALIRDIHQTAIEESMQ